MYPMRHAFILFIFLITTGLQAIGQEYTTAPASRRYARPNLAEKIFIGGNYRETWAMPVRVRVFDIDKEQGGMKITKLGGGMQTKSLRMEDKTGRKWVLRTVDKTVDKAMEAEGIKSGLVKNVTQDMISAAHPYGAVVVPPLAKALGIVTTDPEVVFVPDDPRFGEHRALFANTMCLFEQLEPTLYPGDEVEGDTEDMLKDLKKHPDYRLDTKMLLQARLLDMLIGDWDRHGGQWKWGYHKQDKTVQVYPIPVDHDQAFFHSSGILVPMVRPFTMKHIIGLDDESSNLRMLNRKEWDFDKSLLGGLSEADWRSGIRSFREKLSDAVLLAGVKRLPNEVYDASGDELLEILKGRRDSMEKNALKYYRFLLTHKPKPVAEEAAEGEKEKI